jgi:glucose-6-phosphate 1-dehydrogenase
MIEGVIIIFGASGDLTKRKIVPALYHLASNKKLGNYRIVGASRERLSVDEWFEPVKEFIDGLDENLFQELKAHAHYQQLDFLNENDFKLLAQYVEAVERDYDLSGNRLLYLAAASDFYCPITQQSAASGLARKLASTELGVPTQRSVDGAKSYWHRLVYEKPFGRNLTDAQEINRCIASHFYEEQIYRVDHYLTKEVVNSIALVRFTNIVLEPLWNSTYIDNVQIILSETVGVENRGGYYDAYGAIADVVQNHMLELVALIAMESPTVLTGEAIRTARAKVLAKVQVSDLLLGQYAGYRNEPMVKPDSTTETFALLALTIDNDRWRGVPFFLKTGKCLAEKETVIHINFKKINCLLTHNCPTDSNYLTLQISPEAVFTLSLNIKKINTVDELMPVNMEFCHSCIFGMITPEAYEVIFQEVARGEQSISVRFDEIEACWRIVDGIKTKQLPLFTYEQKTTGPKEVALFEQKHTMRWRS